MKAKWSEWLGGEETYYIRQLLRRLAFSMALMMLCRLLFFFLNRDLFALPPVSALAEAFLVGIRFDLTTVAYANVLLILSFLLPFGFRRARGWAMFQKVLFFVFNIAILVTEIGDAAFFRFSNRRLLWSDKSLISNSLGLFPKLLAEHWYLFFGFGIFLYFFNKLYHKTDLKSPPPVRQRAWIQVFLFFVGVGSTIIAMRGGTQLRPITPVVAAKSLSDMRVLPLALNTSHSLMASSQTSSIEMPNYMSQAEAERIYPIFHISEKKDSTKPMNVVVITLESFGKEYSTFFNSQLKGYQGFMPFFDSLAQQSFYTENSYANGLRSTQGIASVAAGMPSLMEETYIFSPFQANRLESFAAILRKKGYETGFFHGSFVGSMEFNTFAPLVGFEHFYDRAAYPDQRDFDGTWGIWDELFGEFMVKKLNTYKKPFAAQWFTLTSHHPYAVPKWFEEKYPKMDKLQRSVLYADQALRRFFELAKQQDWYENTLFVLSADHMGQHLTAETTPVVNPQYQTREGMYRIPILFFHPANPNLKGIGRSQISSQIDMMPSILDYLKVNENYLSFGRSIFSKTAPPQYAFHFEGGLFQIIDKNYILLFDGKETTALFDLQKDPLQKNDLKNTDSDTRNRMETVL
ncbi:MAG: hypothetical protein RL757_1579, partial [Bacteroidota bacterium]